MSQEEIGAGAFEDGDEREPFDPAIVERLIAEEMAVIKRISPTWIEAAHAQRAILQSLEAFGNAQIQAIKKDPGEKPESEVSALNAGLVGPDRLSFATPAGAQGSEAESDESEKDDQRMVEEPSDTVGQPDEREAGHDHAEGDEVH